MYMRQCFLLCVGCYVSCDGCCALCVVYCVLSAVCCVLCVVCRVLCVCVCCVETYGGQYKAQRQHFTCTASLPRSKLRIAKRAAGVGADHVGEAAADSRGAARQA